MRHVQKEYLLDMPTRSKKRVAIYARVSTNDRGQDPETQLLQLREYAQRRGFDVADEYVDHATGTTEERANYQRLLDDVRKRSFKTLDPQVFPSFHADLALFTSLQTCGVA